jgi:NADH dehydrogenase FAD-containing subunit
LEVWQQVFIIGGGFVGVSALMRLAAPADTQSAQS